MIGIAFIIDAISGPADGGTERQLLGTIARIDRSVYKPHLVCLGEVPDQVRKTVDCEILSLGYEGLLKPSIPRVVSTLRSFLLSRRIRILQTYLEDAAFVAYLSTRFLRPNPALLLSRRDLGMDSRPWYHLAFRIGYAYLYRRCHRVVVNSQAVRGYVCSTWHVPMSHVAVIPNGIDPPTSMPLPSPYYDDFKDRFRIGMIANLKPIKRIDMAIRAIKHLQVFHGVLYADLFVLGCGPLRQHLEALSESLGLTGHVHFLGSVEDVFSHIAAWDASILCSDREGLPNAIMECMAGGLPVVATAVGGCKELIDTESGYLVQAGDQESLASALADLARDRELRVSLGTAGQNKITERYSWKSVMTSLDALYSSVLGTSDLPPTTSHTVNQ